MAFSKVTLDISLNTGCCLAIYNALYGIGLVTAPVGTPTTLLAVFSSPLLADGNYFRLKTQNTGNFPNKVAIGVEIGILVSGTFYPTASLIPYWNAEGTTRTLLDLYYDLSVPWIMIIDNGYSFHGSFIGKMASGKKVGFSFGNDTSIGVNAVCLDDLSALGGPFYFGRTAGLSNYYLEQPLYMLSGGGDILANGDNPDTVQGLSNVAMNFVSGTPVTEVGGRTLFGGLYLNNKETLTTYLAIAVG